MDKNSTDMIAYNIRTACKMLSIGRSRLYQLIGQREIAAKSCGRRTLIDGNSLREYYANLPQAQIGRSRAHN